MPVEIHISHLTIKIEGTPLSGEAISSLDEVVVDHSLHLPSMFTLRLFSADMHWLEDDTFREGKKVEIQAGEPPVTILTGKIAAIEPELSQDLPRLVVRGYDLSHKLYRGKQRRSFNNVTDSDLARQLAQEAGLRAVVDNTPGAPHEYIYQNNQTNAEFLLGRARRLGFELFVEDDTLNFRRPPAGGEAVRLAWGETLLSFRARLSTAEQVNEVAVRGWDLRNKQTVEGRALVGTGSPQIGVTQPGADLAKIAWGEAKIAIVDQFVRSPSEAQVLAQSALDELSSSFVEADGTCDGNAAVKPGKLVEIAGVGSRFNGKYYVTSVIHEWNLTTGLRTHFTISGRRDNGIWSLLEETPAQTQSILGLMVGIVTNNQDPERLMRVRVRIPNLSDVDESAWARLVTPMAGNGRGFMFIPEIDDEVIVGFEHGDIHRPYVLGALWNGKDAPPIAQSAALSGSAVNKRVIKSRAGHTITLDDTSGNEEITIIDKTGSNKIVFHSPDNSMQIKVQGDLTIESLGKITLKAATGLDMSSDTSLSMKGLSGSIEGTTSLTIKDGAGAQIALNGPSVNVNNGALEVI